MKILLTLSLFGGATLTATVLWLSALFAGTPAAADAYTTVPVEFGAWFKAR